MMKYSKYLTVAVLVLTCSIQIANAVIYPFEIFTRNGSYWNQEGRIRCYVDVTGDDNVASFTFYNNSTIDCSIASIYFDDGLLLGISDIINGPGVQFTSPADASNLPAGNTLDPPFETTSDFSAKGVQPPPINGINSTDNFEPVEWVTIQFDLINNSRLTDVFNGLDTGTLRIGIHITSFPDGSSESAVTTIPEPATLLMLAIGAVILRKNKKR
jgi:hypothetical protein